ncbi:hypothetical protein CB1_000672005 [Camelus ferus]|nr:hypothetical protein CB1_000672005 [Camelus ferus]
MNYQQNPRDNFLSLEDCKDIENLESFTDVLDNEGALTSNWEQWDTYCEDLTKYTKLTSCDIWGTKEVDYLGLDDFSSPYQDEEVISKTPTLAQLNSEDSQSVSDSLYYPDSLFSVKQNPLPSSFPDYVKKAKVKINPVPQSRPLLSQVPADAAKENTCYCGVVAKRPEKKGTEPLQGHATPALPFKETQELLLSPLPQEGPGSIAAGESSSLSASTSPTKCSPEEDEEDEEDVDDEDHDEGFGSEHELSENEEEEEEEEDYEDDKDDDISDTFSEPGYENDSVEDLKEMTSISSRKRGKRRYFWEYSEQLTPSQQERMLRPSEWNRDTLPSNMYQKNGLHHGKYAVKKSRRTDVEDLTPNPKKLLQIGNELRKLNKVISDLTPVSELPLTARPRSRKEKNKLASRACRLKKKAQYEANKVKLWGLNTEYDNLLFVINSIKQEIVNRVQNPREERGPNMGQKLEILIKDTLGKNNIG